jgi:uncharacterized protein (DUF779 family)
VTDQPRIQATPAARAALEAVRAREGGQVMFVQSGGCCAGSVPMCFPDGEYLTGDGDELLGDIDGSPFYIEQTLDRALGHPSFVLDVAPGGPEGFSMGTVDGGHFVSRSESCLLPNDSASPQPANQNTVTPRPTRP